MSKGQPEYDPPLSVNEIYRQDPQLAAKLLTDPVHLWRAENGIELIHKEPTLAELNRIWTNWQLMPVGLQRLSDAKSDELFKMTNAEHYKKLLSEYS